MHNMQSLEPFRCLPVDFSARKPEIRSWFKNSGSQRISVFGTVKLPPFNLGKTCALGGGGGCSLEGTPGFYVLCAERTRFRHDILFSGGRDFLGECIKCSTFETSSATTFATTVIILSKCWIASLFLRGRHVEPLSERLLRPHVSPKV